MHKRLKSRRNSWTSCIHMGCRTVVQRHREPIRSLEEVFNFAVVASKLSHGSLSHGWSARSDCHMLLSSIGWWICRMGVLDVRGKEGGLFASRHLVCGVLVLQTHHLFWPSEILLHGEASHQLRWLLLDLGAELGTPDSLSCIIWHHSKVWNHWLGLWSHRITHHPLFSPIGTKASLGP